MFIARSQANGALRRSAMRRFAQLTLIHYLALGICARLFQQYPWHSFGARCVKSLEHHRLDAGGCLLSSYQRQQGIE
jgi:hypothetical protein